jgi:hypothetical protein
LNRGDQGGAVDPQARELLGGELDDDLLILSAEDLDLGASGTRSSCVRIFST